MVESNESFHPNNLYSLHQKQENQIYQSSSENSILTSSLHLSNTIKTKSKVADSTNNKYAMETLFDPKKSFLTRNFHESLGSNSKVNQFTPTDHFD